MITASMLFAGAAHRPGDNRCYYCGADCDDTHATDTYVKDTFSNRDLIKFPNSPYVCEGCVQSVGEGRGDMPMLDGTVKAFTTPRGMAPRLYSWFITERERLAFTKAHISLIREILTCPEKLPDPPFAVVIADSGQKQLIFRSAVALEKASFPVQLENAQIEVSPILLHERLDLASSISRKIGKPVLTEPLGISTYMRADAAGVVENLTTWEKILKEPLSKLAAWLAPPKDKE